MKKFDSSVKWVSPRDLIPYGNNTKKHPEAQVAKIARSIEEFGFDQPIVVDSSMVIIKGHGRREASIYLGLEKVPVLVRDDLTAEQVKAARIADNKTAESEWDAGLLRIEFEDLRLSGYDLAMTGFDSEEIKTLFEGSAEELSTEPEANVGGAHEPTEGNPVSRPGDLWLLGEHRLLCGDSCSKADVARLMAGVRADMVFTDPPYLMDFDGSIGDSGDRRGHNAKHGKIENDKMNHAEGDVFLSQISQMVKAHCKGAFYICFHRLQIDRLMNACTANGLRWRQLLIWEKEHFTLSNSDYKSLYEPILYGWTDERAFYGSKGERDIIQLSRSGAATGEPIGVHGKAVYLRSGDDFYKIEKVKRPKTFIEIDGAPISFAFFDQGEADIWHVDRTKKNDLHPTMKPPDLVKTAILNSSKKGDTVLDLFGGSGTTLVVCESTGRVCRTMEMDPKYSDVIVRRWQEMTGKEAILQGSEKPFFKVAEERA